MNLDLSDEEAAALTEELANITANDLHEARQRAEDIARDLPSSISAEALGVRQKAPYLFLWLRGALMWRTEELARCACDLLTKGDVAAGALLTRGVIESAAILWRLKELLENRHNHSPDEIHDIIEKLLVGFRSEPEFPQAFNILTIIDRIDQRLPSIGIRKMYDDLSEIAHPNWCGVSGLFSLGNLKTLTTQFGRDLDKSVAVAARQRTGIMLLTFLGLFQHSYNSIAEKLPEFIAELEPL